MAAGIYREMWLDRVASEFPQCAGPDQYPNQLLSCVVLEQAKQLAELRRRLDTLDKPFDRKAEHTVNKIPAEKKTETVWEAHQEMLYAA